MICGWLAPYEDGRGVLIVNGMAHAVRVHDESWTVYTAPGGLSLAVVDRGDGPIDPGAVRAGDLERAAVLAVDER